VTGTEPPRIVFADANILINLIHIERLDLLARLPEHKLVVPEPVEVEICHPRQRVAFAAALAAGHFTVEPLTNLGELTLFADLRRVMGNGEAACLAMAAGRGGWVATSDRKRKFRREALRLLGEGRLINLVGLFILAIRQDLITVQDADGYKRVLERHRCRWPFTSFAELITPSRAG